MTQTFQDFMKWYRPGIKYADFMAKLQQTKDPLYEELGKQDRSALEGIASLFSFSERWGREHGMPLWQFWTDEYVEGLAKYIKDEYGADARVLEVGAGDGWLSELLIRKGVNIVATTDNDSWSISHKMKYARPVEKLSYYKAIQKYRPDVILVSWMPYTADWTPGFRYFKSTKGYIIIGESEGGCCGSESCFNPPKGWKVMTHRTDFDEFNVCRTDYHWLGFMKHNSWNYHSCTTDVRRVK